MKTTRKERQRSEKAAQLIPGAETVSEAVKRIDGARPERLMDELCVRRAVLTVRP